MLKITIKCLQNTYIQKRIEHKRGLQKKNQRKKVTCAIEDNKKQCTAK